MRLLLYNVGLGICIAIKRQPAVLLRQSLLKMASSAATVVKNNIIIKGEVAIKISCRKNVVKKSDERKGLVLGIYSAENNNDKSTNKDASPIVVEQLTSSAKKFNDSTNGKLLELLNCSEPLKSGKCRIFYGLNKDFNAVAVAGLGKKGAGVDKDEQYHVGREDVRSAAAVGTLALRDLGMRKVFIDPCGFPDAAAEGAVLSLFSYDELKSKDSRKPNVEVNLFEGDTGSEEAWNKGMVCGEGQNIVRRLMEIPANLLTPTKFAEFAQEYGKKCNNLEIIAHDKQWAENEKMFSFLSVSQGSAQPPVFLEMHLKCGTGAADTPLVVLVGKGVCFDSGGISLKPGASMDKMRADMGGAANVFATLYTLSRLNVKLPFNIIGLTPLVENMPGGKATKPGDIVFARNGKSIKIDNTDAEGRLILADALCYADTFRPAHVLDIATLTGAMHIALGNTTVGVFCTSDTLWDKLLQASIDTGDRMWRMPLFKAYNKKMKNEFADLNNIAKAGTGAGSCVAAGFLKEFIECKSWAHLDIAGVMDADGDMPYISKGMTGRPLRALVKCMETLQL